MNEFEICEVKEQELDVLRAISIQTFCEAFERSNTPENMQAYISEAFSMQALRQQWANPKSKFYFALLDGMAVGYLKINDRSAENFMSDKKGMEIERIYVLERLYGKGIGQKLLEWALQEAHERQADYIWLGVWEHNTRAIRFYEKNGFQTFGKHPFILGQDIQTDWLMYRSL